MTDGSATLTGSITLPGDGADWTPPSWDDIVREHSTRVYRLAYRLTGNQHDAEDLTQEVFVRVFRSLAVPLLRPGLATVGIFSALAAWN